MLPTVIGLGLGVSILSVMALQAVSQANQTLTNQSYKTIAHDAAVAGIELAKQCLTNPNFSNTGVNAIWPQKQIQAGAPANQAYLTSSKCDGTDTQTVVDSSDGGGYSSTYSVKLDDGINQTTIVGSSVSGYVLRSTGTVKVNTPVAGITVQAAQDSVSAFVQVSNSGSVSRDVKQVSTNNNTTCTIATTRGTDTDNTKWWPYCWGENQYGQLGIGYLLDAPSSQLSGSTIPMAVSVEGTKTSAGSSQVHPVCYGATIDSGLIGFLTGWKPACLGISGTRLDYQIPAANGGNQAWNEMAPANVPKVATKVSVGVDHTCAIARDTANDARSAKAYCWGRNDYGQLGNDSTGNKYNGNNQTDPVVLPQAVATTWTKTFPKSCQKQYINLPWPLTGYWTSGLVILGNCDGTWVTPSPVTSPTALGGMTVVDIVAGNGFTCAKYIDPATQSSELSKLQDANASLSLGKAANPTVVSGIQGKLACWGRNDRGQLGLGGTYEHGVDQQYPVNVMDSSTNTQTGKLAGKFVGTLAEVKGNDTTRDRFNTVAATMCATDINSKAFCWGQNDTCQTGVNCTATTPRRYTDWGWDSYRTGGPAPYAAACGLGAPWTNITDDVMTPTAVDGGGTYRNITVSDLWTTAIATSGANANNAYFWGGTMQNVCGALNVNVMQYFPNGPTPLSIGGGSSKTPAIGTQPLTDLTSGIASRDKYDPNPAAAPIRGLPFCAVLSSIIQCANIVPYPKGGTMFYSTGGAIIDMDTSLNGYSCAISKDANNQGYVSCWGTNTKGSLGNRTLDTTGDPTRVDIYRGYTDSQKDFENSALGFPAKAIDTVVYF